MENMKAIDNMSEVLDDEIKKIAKKGDNISPQELDNAYKAMKTIYYGEVIKAMKKAEDEREQEMKGYSQNRGYSYGTMREPYFHTYDQSMDNYSRDGSYADGRSYGDGRSYDGSYDMGRDGGQSHARAGRDGDGDGRYSEGSYDNSYRRGRDAMGRFTSRDGGYSGHEDKEQLRQQLQQMQQKLNQMQ
jgi:hypothetical protein